ncbi:hypothetical protein pb186bvf_019473 [Paramecium bursaria]
MQNSNPNNSWSGRSYEPPIEQQGKKKYQATPYPHNQIRAIQQAEQNNGGSTILSPVQGQQLQFNVLTPNPQFIQELENEQFDQSIIHNPLQKKNSTYIQPPSGKSTPSQHSMQNSQYNTPVQQQFQGQFPQMYNPNLTSQTPQNYYQQQQQPQSNSQTFNPLQQSTQQNYLQNTNQMMNSQQQGYQGYQGAIGLQSNFQMQSPTHFMNQQVQMTSPTQQMQQQYAQSQFGSQQQFYQGQVSQSQGQQSSIQQFFPQTTQDLTQIQFQNQLLVNQSQQPLQQLQFNIKPKYLQDQYNEEQDQDYVPQEEEEADDEEYIEESNQQDMQEEEEFDDQNFDLEEYKKWRANN